MLCPDCGTENDDAALDCAACGAGLAGDPVPAGPKAAEVRRVHVAETLADAVAVKEALETEGFAAAVREEDGDGAGPSVWVPELQAEKAVRLIIAHFGEAEAAGAPDWTCPGCAEEIEGLFTECWQCGTARPLS
ncbi:MAG: hypothetical protein ACRDJO_03475 [Actinomycetota bacterium]